MVSWIEAIASGDWNAILGLLTASGTLGFGSICVIIANKFLKYKKSTEEVIAKLEKKLLPAFKEIANDVKVEIVEEIREDLKVVAESVAVSVNQDADSKIVVIENVAKLGVKKEVIAKSKAKVEEEIAREEAKKEEAKQVIDKLENNKIETL
jgi:hypothetical protein